MKKLTIAATILMLLALLVPSLASAATPSTSGSTDVTVSTGGGTPPIVKAVWEQEPLPNWIAGTTLVGSSNPVTDAPESGDPTHQISLSQINPPMVKCATKEIDYYAVVTDEQDNGNVYEAFAYVYHPENSPSPYNGGYDPDGLFLRYKYKVTFTRIDDKATAIALINAADAAHLITYSAAAYYKDEITGAQGEIIKDTAKLWVGTATILYEQPAGDYAVRVWAVDTNNNRSSTNGLLNYFNYVPTSGVEVDFTGIVYGSVNLGVETPRAGDIIWPSTIGLAGQGQADKATVRNIGNTWARVTVNESDMGFGFTGNGPGTALSSSSPLGAASNQNVNFDFKMGNNDANEIYFDPGVTVTSPNALGLSTKDELDFSILVKNGSGHKTGSITISSTIDPFTNTSVVVGGYTDPCPVVLDQ
jgi:hypothetical protein